MSVFACLFVVRPLIDIQTANQPETTVKVAACPDEGHYVITSPNTDYIPQPFVGLVRVYMRNDYRYGENDPFQWPQVFTPELDFLSVIRHPYKSPHRYEPIWWTPSCTTDFEPVEGGVFKSLGLLARASLVRLSDLVDEMTRLVNQHGEQIGRVDVRLWKFNIAMVDARNRLLHFPATFRDTCFQVREVQRFWLLCRAVIDYTRINTKEEPATSTRPGIMGAFTTDPGVMQTLARGGIPVWFIQPRVSSLDKDIGDKMVVMKLPSEITRIPWQSNAPAMYSGLSGYNHLNIICSIKHMYLDVSQSPLIFRYDYRTKPSTNTGMQTPSLAGPSRAHEPKATARKIPTKAGKMQVSNRKYYYSIDKIRY